MKRSIIFLFGQIGLTGSFIRTIFIAFVFGIIIFSSCQKNELEYSLSLRMYGPYSETEYQKLRNSVWLKKPIDSLGWGEFYIAEISNMSLDTVCIAVEKYDGIIWFQDLCLQYIEKGCLAPRKEGSFAEYLEDWDTIIPYSSRRYLHLSPYPYSECDFLQLSFGVKSEFFDSLNLENPINYWLGGANPIQMKHPVFLFRMDERRFIPAGPMDIQKEFNRTGRRMEQLKRPGNIE